MDACQSWDGNTSQEWQYYNARTLDGVTAEGQSAMLSNGRLRIERGHLPRGRQLPRICGKLVKFRCNHNSSFQADSTCATCRLLSHVPSDDSFHLTPALPQSRSFSACHAQVAKMPSKASRSPRAWYCKVQDLGKQSRLWWPWHVLSSSLIIMLFFIQPALMSCYTAVNSTPDSLLTSSCPYKLTTFNV